MTLVVAVGTKEGILLAADSRQTIGQLRYCDDREKIFAPQGRPRTLFTVTGHASFIAPPPGWPDVEDPCAWLASAPRTFDMVEIVRRTLESFRRVGLAEIEALRDACVAGFSLYALMDPGIRHVPFANNEVCRIVVCHFDVNAGTRHIWNFSVNSPPSGAPSGSEISAEAITGSSRQGIAYFGENAYVNRVLGPAGIGRPFLAEATRDFILGDRPVARISTSEAVAAATQFIQAASDAATIEPPPTGIGGRIAVWMISRKPKPERLS